MEAIPSSFFIEPLTGPLFGYKIGFDAFEKKTVEKIKKVALSKPKSYGGAEVLTGVNMGYYEGPKFIKSGDIEVLDRDEPLWLIEVKVGTDFDIIHGNIENQMIKLLAAPHKHKALLISGRFWSEKLINNGWKYALSAQPPAKLIQFFAFARRWLRKGIKIYWLSDVEHLLAKAFELISKPPVKPEVEYQQYTTRKVVGSPFARQLQQIDGITYEFATAISDKWPTPAHLHGVSADEIAQVMHEVDIEKAKIKKRKARTFKTLPNYIYNYYSVKSNEN